MRVRTRWNQKDKDHTLEEIASVIAANSWKIAGESLLNLENEGFETISHSQRLDVIAEFCAYLLHCADRLVYGKFDEDERARFITVMGSRLVGIMQDNRVDANGPGDYRAAFVDLLNARMDEYSECKYSEKEGPGFGLRRQFGEHVRVTMGAKDNKWITDYVLDGEAPKALEHLKRAIGGMFPEQFGMDTRALRGAGRNWDA